MFKVDDKKIRALMMRRGWTISDLSNATHLHDKTCRKLINGGTANLKVIATAAQALGVQGEELILRRN